MQEGLGKIKTKFKDIDALGPVWLINFEDIDDEEEKERVKRDAYERVNAFLDPLGILKVKQNSLVKARLFSIVKKQKNIRIYLLPS